MDGLTAEHRSKQLLLRKHTITQTKSLVPLLKWDDLDGSYGRLERAMRPVVAKNLQTSAGLSSAYLRAFRAKRGPSGRVDPVRVSLDPDQFATSLRVTSVVAAKKAAARGLAGDLAMRSVGVLVGRSMARLVLNGGRQTIRQTVISEGAGWTRVGAGACDWCQQYLDGEVHYTEGYDFDAHDGCGCTAEPVYD